MHTWVVKQNGSQRLIFQLAQVGQATCKAGVRKNAACEYDGITCDQQGDFSDKGQLTWGNAQ